MDEKFVEKIREEFPITKNFIYLNHASMGPMAERAVRATERYIRSLQLECNLREQEWYEMRERVRDLGSQLIGAEPAEIAFVGNTSHGATMIANGFPFREGDTIVTCNEEFPANVYPWLNLSPKVETRFVQSNKGRILFEDLTRRVDSSTRIIALSFVEFSSGFRNDLERIGEFCERRGIFLFVDAIQGLGALTLDVKKMKINGLSCGAPKWLLGPLGISIFYLDRKYWDAIKVTDCGWIHVVDWLNFRNYNLKFVPDAKKFEFATLNYSGICGMGASIEMLLELGIGAIEERIHHLTDRLCAGLVRKGYQIYSSRQPKEWSGIVSCFKPGLDSNGIFDRLRADKIVVSVRDDRIRVSPHFYNTEAEIDKIVEVLP
jgi:selenocysteine lyase/cysteine desulfurase